ncbi:di-heme oxidoredictase family protein [Lentilitoribacter sp. EG35]|uniref:di-heme oxidoreductase family protein n=1 Tax=Lentilitoribacter sp. EG35 TaxID=3234192 RepID=UPI0034602B94
MPNQNRNSYFRLPHIFVAAFCISTPAHAQIAVERDDLSDKDRARVQEIVKPTTDFSKAENFEVKQGGAGTSIKKVNRDAFSHFSTNITFKEEETFKLGNALFRKLWVSSPSSTQASDGLGPLFNARACQSCHIKDGRGHPPEGDTDATSMFLRLAKSPTTKLEEQELKDFVRTTFPDPTYGGQLQDLAVPGLDGEGQMKITYENIIENFADGETITLRKPSYEAINLNYGPLDPHTTLSPRVTPQMIGLGLLEAIHESDIVNNADPDDQNNDGISGKYQIIGDGNGNRILARFGWKAEMPTIRQQSAGAFAGDIGISTPDKPNNHGDCTDAQTQCLAMPHGEQARLGVGEAPDEVLSLVTFYSQNLAVPARRNAEDMDVLTGKKHFYDLGCASCHRPKYVTSRNAENKAHQFQLIWPYTDLLLHDMGEGLADGQQVGIANGREWRTPPLWGIGLTKTVNDHTFFLHDGRARNLTEAIVWHGGEAETAKNKFLELDKSARDNLIKFLASL